MKIILVLLFLLVASKVCAEGPLFRQKDPIAQQEFENVYQDLRTKISTFTTSSSLISGSSNYIQNSLSPTIATQVFSVSTGVAGNFTSSTGTITSFNASTGTITVARVSTQTWKGFGVLPILQVQQYTTSTSSDIVNTTFQLTTLSGSITPKLSTSKIYVIANGNLACTGGGVCYASIYRDSTNLAASDGGFEANTAISNNHTTMTYYDSPGTTSAVTYSARTRVNGGGVTASFPGTDGGIYTTTAVLTLVEIAQ